MTSVYAKFSTIVCFLAVLLLASTTSFQAAEAFNAGFAANVGAELDPETVAGAVAPGTYLCGSSFMYNVLYSRNDAFDVCFVLGTPPLLQIA